MYSLIRFYLSISLKGKDFFFVNYRKQVIDLKYRNMFVQVYLFLFFNVVLVERERVRVGVFQVDDIVLFGIYRSGLVVDLGV